MRFEKYQMPAAAMHAELASTKEGWLDPLVLAPRISHARSIIILHGRGDNAYSFGTTFLSVHLPKSSMTFPEVFPDAKFILPTSKLRRALALHKTRIPQWFDIYSLLDPDGRQELQHEGLHDSARFIHHIIRQEAELVGLENVILGGLSQGCATGLHVMMSFEGHNGQHLGGFFGMSGWLPFAKQLNLISTGKMSFSTSIEAEGMTGAGKCKAEDPFGDAHRSENDDANLSAQATQFVKEHVMDFPDNKVNNTSVLVPIFLGHGELDEKILPELGRSAADIMAKLGWNVTWKSYSDLDHWYSREELEDVSEFIRGVCITSKVK